MRDGEQAGIARVFHAITLKRAEIISIAEFGAQLLKDFPVALLALRAHLLFQVAFEVGRDMVIVEERVVYVEKEDEAGHGVLPYRRTHQRAKCDAPLNAGLVIAQIAAMTIEA